MGVGEEGAGVGECIDIGCVSLRVSVEAADPVILVIDGNHEHVGFGCWWRLFAAAAGGEGGVGEECEGYDQRTVELHSWTSLMDGGEVWVRAEAAGSVSKVAGVGKRLCCGMAGVWCVFVCVAVGGKVCEKPKGGSRVRLCPSINRGPENGG